MKKYLFYLSLSFIALFFFSCSDNEANSSSYDFGLKFNPEYGTVVNINTPLMIGITVDSLDTSANATYTTKIYSSSPSFSEIIVDNKEVVSTDKLDNNYKKENTLYFTFQASKIGKYTITTEVSNEKQSKERTIEIEVTSDMILKLNCDAAAGYVTGAGTYPKGTTITVKAEPKEGYKFVAWLVDGKEYSNSTECTIVLSDHLEMEAKFEAIIYPFSGTANIEFATVQGGNGKFGENVVISTALPSTWEHIYEFDGWYKNDVKVSDDLHYMFKITHDNTFQARFEKKIYISGTADFSDVYQNKCNSRTTYSFKGLTAKIFLATYELIELGDYTNPGNYTLKNAVRGVSTAIELSFDIEYSYFNSSCQRMTESKVNQKATIAANQLYIQVKALENTSTTKHYYGVDITNITLSPTSYDENRTINLPSGGNSLHFVYRKPRN